MYKLIRDEKDLIFDIDPLQPVFCDTETAEDMGLTNGGLYGKIRLFQLYQTGWDVAIIIDCFFVPLEKVLAILKPLHLVFHNSSYDLHTVNLYTESVWIPAKFDDTLYLSRLVYFDKSSFDFYAVLEYAEEADYIIEGIDKKEAQKHDWGLPLTEKYLIYAACDVLYLQKLWKHVNMECDNPVYILDIQNMTCALDYDRHGIPINRNTIKRLRLEQMTIAENALAELPLDLNVNSSKQVCAFLGTTSADATTLGILALKGSKEAQTVLDAKKSIKALMFLNKYDRPIMKGFHNACGAITGRMSCVGGDRFDHENTQQPPRLIFPAFEAPEGKLIIYFDYSQLELKYAVAYVGEQTMAQMMKDGLDLHTHTGCKLFNCTPEELPKLKRMITKFYNFGTIYGGGALTLQQLLQSKGRIDLPLKEVAALRTKWLAMYSGFKEWHDMHSYQLKVYGYVDITTALGRHIRTYTFTDSLNFPIQGSSVEATKLAVYLLTSRYSDAYIINVVHDSIALLQDENNADLWIDRLNECMLEAWYTLIENSAIPDLPMPAEAEACKLWP